MSSLTHVQLGDGVEDRNSIMRILEAAYGQGVHRGDVLDWLCDENPVGKASRVAGQAESGERVSFAAAVPQRWAHADGRSALLGLIVNIAIAPGGRGRGGTGALVQRLMDVGLERGWDAVWGVPNNRSVGGLVKIPAYLPFRQMDTYLVRPGRRSQRAGATRLSSTPGDWVLTSEGAAWLDQLEHRPRWGIAQRWEADSLAWRLSRPGQRYALYRGTDASVVVLRRRVGGVPVCVVAKILVHKGVTLVRAEPLIDAVRAAERCVAAVYVGWNSRVPPLANRVPRRWLPSGLNVGGFQNPGGGWGWGIETCELLDGDQL